MANMLIGERFLKSFNVFKTKSNQHYENVKTFQRCLPSVVQKIMSSFDIQQRSQFSILSVGSGTGEVDIEIVNIVRQELQKQQQWSHISIFNRAIEPNLQSSNKYKENIAKFGDVVSSRYEVRQQTFQEYQESKEDPVSFDIVHFMHSLYYVDLEQTVLYCLENQLTEMGCLVCLMNDNESICNTVLMKQDELSNKASTLAQTSEELIKMAEKCGWKHEINCQKLFVDVTEVLNADSVEGNLLLDFLTNTENFRKSANNHVLEVTLEFIEQLAIAKDGKYLGEIKESLVFIYK
ncbi:Hypothetical predicted protein [Paramuricea clavata]|uniref:Uncharacterized protein n=1 Tax=Paramuricea clavata TaxID=317549 RepID=A0A6S7HXT4_PARCT|nr:Hypothetical predicted protein [Paramuricea clavata]